MIIGFNLIYNLDLSWLKQNLNRGYKLLHVFWNTLYVYILLKKSFAPLVLHSQFYQKFANC